MFAQRHNGLYKRTQRTAACEHWRTMTRGRVSKSVVVLPVKNRFQVGGYIFNAIVTVVKSSCKFPYVFLKESYFRRLIL